MNLRLLLAATAALMLSAGTVPGDAQAAPEKTKLTLGVGGKALFYYLPLTIAEQKGYFKAEGLDVTINDFGGGSKSLQALVGGSDAAVTGAYEPTTRTQPKGQGIREEEHERG